MKRLLPPSFSLFIQALGCVVLLAAAAKMADLFFFREWAWSDLVHQYPLLIECLVGIGVVAWPESKTGRMVLLALFAVFNGVIARLVIAGATSCDCFGRLPAPPLAMLVFDIFALVGVCAGMYHTAQGRWRSIPLLLGSIMASGFAGGYWLQPVIYGRIPTDAIADTDAVAPHNWRGRVLPIRDSLPRDTWSTIEANNTLLVVFNPSCEHCRAELLDFVTLLRTEEFADVKPNVFLLPTSKVDGGDEELKLAVEGITWLPADALNDVFVRRVTYLSVKQGVVVNTMLGSRSALTDLSQTGREVDRNGPDWIRLAQDASPRLKAKAGQPSFITASHSTPLIPLAVGGTCAIPVWVTNRGSVDASLVAASADCSCTIPLLEIRKLTPGLPAHTMAFVSPKAQGKGEVSILFTANSNDQQDFAVGRISYQGNGRFTVTPHSRVSIDAKMKPEAQFRVEGEDDLWEFQSFDTTLPDEVAVDVRSQSPVKRRSVTTVDVKAAGYRQMLRKSEMVWLIFRHKVDLKCTAVGLVMSFESGSGDRRSDIQPECSMVYPKSVARISPTAVTANFDGAALRSAAKIQLETVALSKHTTGGVAISHRMNGDEFSVTMEGVSPSEGLFFLRWKSESHQITNAPIYISGSP